MIFKRTTFYLLTFFALQSLYAQDNELRMIVDHDINLTNNLSADLSTGVQQGYNSNDYTRFDSRATIVYKPAKHFFFDIGFRYRNVNKYGLGKVNEYRPHQSINIQHRPFHKFALKHRLRMEERFVNYNYKDNSQSSWLRYRVKTSNSIDLINLPPHQQAYWLVSGEITFNVLGKINEDYNFHQRSRCGIGLGYKFSPRTSIEGKLYYQTTYDKVDYSKHDDLTIFQLQLKNKLNFMYTNKEKE